MLFQYNAQNDALRYILCNCMETNCKDYCGKFIPLGDDMLLIVGEIFNPRQNYVLYDVTIRVSV